MRTTIDLPDDSHRQAMSIARETSRTLSETVAALMRRGLEQGVRPDQRDLAEIDVALLPRDRMDELRLVPRPARKHRHGWAMTSTAEPNGLP